MPWELEIHHIGLTMRGDATLIVAKNIEEPIKDPKEIRSLLIDGGSLTDVTTVDNYLKSILNKKPLNIMVVTHYHDDHMNGIRGLLELENSLYDEVLIFDPGEPSVIPKHNTGPSDTGVDNQPQDREANYIRYLNAIEKRKTIKRITSAVLISAQEPSPPGWEEPNWLVGKEILHYPKSPTEDAPTIHCIAANTYFKNNTADNKGESVEEKPLGKDREENQKSLAFLVQFGTFKYFIGGDLENSQEDNLIPSLLPPSNGNGGGRVHALKLSHHGSKNSSSSNFLSGLNPKVAIISNGPNNQYGHPDQDTVNRLNEISVSKDRPQGLKKCYLTGVDLRTEGPKTADITSELFEIPGYPPEGKTGNKHIIISVSQSQSKADSAGEKIDNLTVSFMDEDKKKDRDGIKKPKQVSYTH